MSSPSRVFALTRVLGQSGRRYLIERTLQEKPVDNGHVYLATAQNQKFVLKSVAPDQFQYFTDMFNDLRSSPYIRVAEDSNVEYSMFAYRYIRGHLLSFFQKDIPPPTTKRILRDALRGIATLHDKGIVHTDIKPNNILVGWEEEGENIAVEQVLIADIEDAAYVPEDTVIEGAQRGNWMWRSPEAHVAGPMHKPMDIFSFGLVCIYAMTKQVVMAVDEEKLPEGIVLEDVLIERQLSYFADWNGMRGLIDYFGNDPKAQYFTMVANDFTEKNPRRPFDTRRGLESDFKDLVMRMMNVDPRKRLTAKEALAHEWFAEVP